MMMMISLANLSYGQKWIDTFKRVSKIINMHERTSNAHALIVVTVAAL